MAAGFGIAGALGGFTQGLESGARLRAMREDREMRRQQMELQQDRNRAEVMTNVAEGVRSGSMNPTMLKAFSPMLAKAMGVDPSSEIFKGLFSLAHSKEVGDRQTFSAIFDRLGEDPKQLRYFEDMYKRDPTEALKWGMGIVEDTRKRQAEMAQKEAESGLRIDEKKIEQGLNLDRDAYQSQLRQSEEQAKLANSPQARAKQQLMAQGIDERTATVLAYGQGPRVFGDGLNGYSVFDPVTREMKPLQPGATGAGAEQPVEPEASGAPAMPEANNLPDPTATTGIPGRLATAYNMIADPLNFPVNKTVLDASQELARLNTETETLLAEGLAGRPSNFLLQEFAKIAPGKSVFEGEAGMTGAFEKTMGYIKDRENDVTQLLKTARTKPAIDKLRAQQQRLKALKQRYQGLYSRTRAGKAGQKAARPGIESFGR